MAFFFFIKMNKLLHKVTANKINALYFIQQIVQTKMFVWVYLERRHHERSVMCTFRKYVETNRI